MVGIWEVEIIVVNMVFIELFVFVGYLYFNILFDYFYFLDNFIGKKLGFV